MTRFIGLFIAAAALATVVPPEAHAQSRAWQRSKMAQGFYAAYTENGAGVLFRVDCGASADGARTEVQSITYIPGRAVPPGDAAKGAITIDGKNFPATFKTVREGSDPVEIQLGWDDKDSLELLKDIVARIRKSRSLTIDVSQFHLRDTFGLSAAPQALGRCE